MDSRPARVTLLAIVAILPACHRARVQQSLPLNSLAPPADPSLVDARYAPCVRTRRLLESAAGAGAVDCVTGKSLSAALRCSADAFRSRLPFFVCSGGFGMDSWAENGAAGTVTGDIVEFYWDDLGPAYRERCVHAAVSVAPDRWPMCKQRPIDRVNLRTGKPYEALEETFGEPWPRPCAAAASIANRFAFPPKPLESRPLVSDPTRWNIRCSRFSVAFELLIDGTGAVRCSRLAERVEQWPAGLAAEMRTNLRWWRFEPPTLNGEAFAIRWGMRANGCEDPLRPLTIPRR